MESMKDAIETNLEALVAHGDLLEHREVDWAVESKRGVLLYAAPPSFVPRASGGALLLGVAPDEVSPIPPDLSTRIEYVNHVRRLNAAADENVRDALCQLGLIELSYETWLKSPPAETPKEHVSRVDALLNAADPATSIPGLLLLDSTRSVWYYRGRWAEPKAQTGRFVARRSQAYGADLWCYVQIRSGVPERFIDLPLTSGRRRGCDEAWRVQMAIDMLQGEPQRFRLRNGPGGMRIIEFFSPVPMWARRRWDAVGEPITSTGCLFAYKFSNNEVEEEVTFARDMLWLTAIAEDRAR
jgi:hypothetical protein